MLFSPPLIGQFRFRVDHEVSDADFQHHALRYKLRDQFQVDIRLLFAGPLDDLFAMLVKVLPDGIQAGFVDLDLTTLGSAGVTSTAIDPLSRF